MNKIQIENRGGRNILCVEGALKTADAEAFREKLMEMVVKEQKILVDLAKADFICSAVLKAFLAAQMAVDESEGKTMVIQNANEEIMEVFDMTGFVNILTIEG